MREILVVRIIQAELTQDEKGHHVKKYHQSMTSIISSQFFFFFLQNHHSRFSIVIRFLLCRLNTFAYCAKEWSSINETQDSHSFARWVSDSIVRSREDHSSNHQPQCIKKQRNSNSDFGWTPVGKHVSENLWVWSKREFKPRKRPASADISHWIHWRRNALFSYLQLELLGQVNANSHVKLQAACMDGLTDSRYLTPCQWRGS